MTVKDSGWWEGLTREAWTKFNGINESVSPEESLQEGRTEKADGFGFGGNALRTNRLGMATLHFGISKDAKRCYGIVPASTRGFFYTIFAKPDGTSLSTTRDYNSLFSLGATNVNAENTKKLVSSCVLNGLVITADGASLRKNVGTTIDNLLVQVPQAPAFNADSGSGISGTFYFRCTLVDAYGNETGGGNVSAARTVSDKTINPTVAITGFDLAIKGYTKIRWYRTVTQTTTPSDTNDLTYYYLGSSKDSTIVPATTTYTIADATTDANLVLNASMRNAKPVTSNTGTFNADICFVFENRLFVLGTIENGTSYQNRVRWSDITDSTEVSIGNPISFHADDYNDLESDDLDGCIGGFALGGRGWISKGDSVFSMTPTYSTERGQQFAFAKISDEYGMFHHTCADIGGAVIGRTRNNIVLFNGSSFKPLGGLIDETLNQLAFPDGDSGVFDYATQRYYLTVMDPRIGGSFLKTGSNQALVQAFRNSVIVYDLGEKKFEIYPGVAVQYLKKLEDSANNERIFYGGNCCDVGMFVPDSILTGPVWSFVGTRIDTHALNPGSVTPASGIVGKTLHVLAHIDSSNSRIVFNDFQNTISSVATNRLNLTNTGDALPGLTPYLCAIDVASGVAATGLGTEITDNGTNYFTDANIKYFAAADGGTTGYTFSVVTSATTPMEFQTSSTLRLYERAGQTTNVLVGEKYLLIPRNFPDPGSMSYNIKVPSHDVMSPAFGAQNASIKKMFRHLVLKCKGYGLVTIKTFLDSSPTASQTIYVTLSNQTSFAGRLVNLNGDIGTHMRVEIKIWRGAGWMEINELSCFYKGVGGLRNA